MKRMYSTLRAEQLMMGIILKNKISQWILPRNDLEILGFRANVPQAQFPAGSAIAFAGEGKVEGDDVFDCPAETTSVVFFEGLGHYLEFESDWSGIEFVKRRVDSGSEVLYVDWASLRSYIKAQAGR